MSAQEAVRQAHDPSQVRAPMSRLRLRFLDWEIEWRYRTATRAWNLRQARFAFLLVVFINLPFVALDPITYHAHVTTISLVRVFGLTGLLLLLYWLTTLRFYQTRWPPLLIVAVLAFTLFYAFANTYGGAEPAYFGGYTLVLMGAYVLLPFIFMYGVITALTGTAIYLAIPMFAGILQDTDLWVVGSQLVVANTIGMVVLYRRERNDRRDFIAAEALQAERQRYYDLLVSVLPQAIAERLQRGEKVADLVERSSVLFADIVNFTGVSAARRPDQIVDLLNAVFGRFDKIVERHGLEKIKTIGDAYMIAGGLHDDGDDQLLALAECALDMRAAARDLRDPDDRPVLIRIGIANGPVVAGVIGERRFLYDLWGDTVNTASRMETNGDAGRIHISDDVAQGLDDQFTLEPRGEIEIKGKGPMRTWYLTGRREAPLAAE